MNHNETKLMNVLDESLCRVLQEAGRENKELNLPRWETVLKVKGKLDRMLEQYSGEVSTVTIFPAFCSAAVTVEVDSFEVCGKDKGIFFEILKSANNVEVLPLTNGRLRLSLVFRGVLYTEKRKGNRKKCQDPYDGWEGTMHGGSGNGRRHKHVRYAPHTVGGFR